MVDYSKWKDIEVSDDEDETRSNMDTPTWFRLHYQARVERRKELRKEREDLDQCKAKNTSNIAATRRKMAEFVPDTPQAIRLKKLLAVFEEEEKKIQDREDELNRKEKKFSGHVDINTIRLPDFNKTVNTESTESDEDLDEDEDTVKFRKFIIENDNILKRIGMVRTYEDFQLFLTEYPHLVCEETAKYLVLWCINLETEQEHYLMERVAHKTNCMQFILELARQMKLDPRACVGIFVARMLAAEQPHSDTFYEELEKFKKRVKKMSAEAIQEERRQQEEKERAARLGPGGLDPVEVYEELPDELKKCFDAQDVPMLQATIAKMPNQEAIYYMKRCVDSGLWLPNKVDGEDEDAVKDNTSSDLSCKGDAASGTSKSSVDLD